MKFPLLKSNARRWIAIACTLAAGFPPAVHGQIDALKKAVAPQETVAAAIAEKPEDARKRLEQWLQEARDTLVRLEAPGAVAGLPAGITPAELGERLRDLEQMVLSVTRSIKNINSVADAHKELERARANDAAWTGFVEEPPYPLLMVDELLNERDAIRANLTSSKSSLANYERLLSGLVAEAKSAEDNVSRMILAVQNADDGNRDAAKWRMDAARAKARVHAARSGMMQGLLAGLKDRVAAATLDLALIDRKVAVAKASSRFSDEDLAKLGKIAEERKKAAQKEIDAAAKRLKTAMAARNQAQATLDSLTAIPPEAPAADAVELAKFRLEVAESRVDALQSVIEELESLIQLENINFKAYQDRKAILDAADEEKRAAALAILELLLDRLRAWENVADNEISSATAELGKLESRIASITTDDPRFALLNEKRVAKSEQLAMIQRIAQAVVAQRKLVKRWVTEYTPEPAEQKFGQRLSTLASNTWEGVKKFWGIEVMSYENKVEVDGQTITGKIPVTLGTLLRALLFFVIGYWISSKIANRIEASLISRGHLADSQARTLRTWGMIVVGVFLALGTLSFLKIPLTVFAFFGGALAIGLGFGMQTLIKNFISGIIVLVERKVRVGDILDVDGIIGTVTEVNTRSSVIRGADDVETMIPNSAFLENRVTNWTLTSSKVRRSLRVGVAYGTSPQTVMAVLTESAARHGLVLKTPEPFATFDDFGDSALIFSLYFWVELGKGTNAMIVASDLRLMIEKRFTDAGIGVPYPQREMHLTTDKPIQIQMAPAPETPPAPEA
jgi:small-conductance mechanosensitive channel